MEGMHYANFGYPGPSPKPKDMQSQADRAYNKLTSSKKYSTPMPQRDQLFKSKPLRAVRKQLKKGICGASIVV